MAYRCWLANGGAPSLALALVRQECSTRAADGSFLTVGQDCHRQLRPGPPQIHPADTGAHVLHWMLESPVLVKLAERSNWTARHFGFPVGRCTLPFPAAVKSGLIGHRTRPYRLGASARRSLPHTSYRKLDQQALPLEARSRWRQEVGLVQNPQLR